MEEHEDKQAQEVNFWRRFIVWWELQHGTPAPERMYEALVLAEQRTRSQGDTTAVEWSSSRH